MMITNRPKIILCTSKNDAKIINKLSNNSDISKLIIISFRSDLDYILNKEKFRIFSSYDFISTEASKEIYNFSISLSGAWNKLGKINEELKFLGVSYTDSVSLDLPCFFLKILRDIEIIRNIIDKLNPTRIISLSDIHSFNGFEPKHEGSFVSSISRYVCKESGVKFSLLNKKSSLSKVNNQSLENLKLWSVMFVRKILSEYKMSDNNKINILGFDCYYFSKLIEEMIKDDSINVSTFNYSSKKRFDSFSVKENFKRFNSIETFCSFQDYKLYLKEKKRIISIWSKIKNNHNFTSLFTYKKHSFWQIIEEMLGEIIVNSFSQIALNLLSAKRMHSINKFNFFITWSDCISINRSLSLFFKNLNVPTAVVQHGAILFPIDYAPPVVDHIFVWGDDSKSWYVKKGVNPSKLIVSGSPNFEEIIKKALVKQSKNKPHYLDKNKKTILYCSQPQKPYLYSKTSDKKFYLFNKLFNLIKKNNNLELIIKLHPQEFNQYDLLTQFKNEKFSDLPIFIFRSGRNISEFIYFCDLFIFPDSTSGFQGIFLEKNLLYLREDSDMFNLPYESLGVNTAKIGDDLEKIIINSILRGNTKPTTSSEKILINYFKDLNIDSSLNIINKIKSLI